MYRIQLDPGPWAQYVKRADNIGLPLHEVSKKYMMESNLYATQLFEAQQTQQNILNALGESGASFTPPKLPIDNSVTFAGSTPFSQAGGTITLTHTPTATPSAVVVFVTNTTTAFNRVGTITYGGVPLTLVTAATDSSGENMNTSAYFLGSGVLSGAQTVSITYSGAGSDRRIVNVITLANAQNAAMAVQNSNTIGGDTANPQITLTTGGNNCMALCQIGSGFDVVGSLTPLGTMTSINSVASNNRTVYADRQTTSGTDNFTIGYTGAIDDVAMVALNVKIA